MKIHAVRPGHTHCVPFFFPPTHALVALEELDPGEEDGGEDGRPEDLVDQHLDGHGLRVLLGQLLVEEAVEVVPDGPVDRQTERREPAGRGIGIGM